MPPGQQQRGQGAAALGKIFPQHCRAEHKHDDLPHQIQPQLLRDQLARIEPRHQPAAGAEQRHVKRIDTEK